MPFNQYFAVDEQDRVKMVLDASNITVTINTEDGAPIGVEITHPIVDLGETQAVVVAVAQGSVEATITNETLGVEVQNWPADPASGTNQLTIAGKLDDVLTKLNGGLPNALIDGLVGVSEANSTLIFGQLSQINAKLPSELFGDRLKVETKDGRPMVPLVGNGTAQPHPTLYELSSANANSSPGGWIIKNEHETRRLRIGDSSVTDTVGFLLGPKETLRLPSSSLEDHYVVGPDGATDFSLIGAS